MIFVLLSFPFNWMFRLDNILENDSTNSTALEQAINEATDDATFQKVKRLSYLGGAAGDVSALTKYQHILENMLLMTNEFHLCPFHQAIHLINSLSLFLIEYFKYLMFTFKDNSNRISQSINYVFHFGRTLINGRIIHSCTHKPISFLYMNGWGLWQSRSNNVMFRIYGNSNAICNVKLFRLTIEWNLNAYNSFAMIKH